jgi:hypothetical protein
VTATRAEPSIQWVASEPAIVAGMPKATHHRTIRQSTSRSRA